MDPSKIGPVRSVKVTHLSEPFGIEMQVNSVKNDGSLSWIVISSGMNTYVEEILRRERRIFSLRRGGEWFRHRETDRDKRANRVHHPVLSQRCPVPIDQRKWNDIPAVNNVIKGSLSWRFSKINAAIERNSLLTTLCRDFEKGNAARSANQKLLFSSSTRK